MMVLFFIKKSTMPRVRVLCVYSKFQYDVMAYALWKLVSIFILLEYCQNSMADSIMTSKEERVICNLSHQ